MTDLEQEQAIELCLQTLEFWPNPLLPNFWVGPYSHIHIEYRPNSRLLYVYNDLSLRREGLQGAIIITPDRLNYLGAEILDRIRHS